MTGLHPENRPVEELVSLWASPAAMGTAARHLEASTTAIKMYQRVGFLYPKDGYFIFEKKLCP